VSNLIEAPDANDVAEIDREVIADMEVEKVIRLEDDFVNCFIKMEWKMHNSTIVTGGFKLIV
jgi:hypothetical protein